MERIKIVWDNINVDEPDVFTVIKMIDNANSMIRTIIAWQESLIRQLTLEIEL
jgi:hypothetical protein